VDRTEQTAVVQLVKEAEVLPGASTEETCAATIAVEIAHAASCGSAADLILSAIATDEQLTRASVERAMTSTTGCVASFVAGLASMPRGLSWAAPLVEEWTSHQDDPMRRSGGLVVLGSLALKARKDGQLQAASHADATLLRELRLPIRSQAEQLQRLEAAGNAGCEPCTQQLLRALQGSSHEVRRTAVGAFRFLTSEVATASMCRVLQQDRDATVREQSAWALGWGQNQPKERVNCLVRAAARDPSGAVRLSATRALAALSHDVPLARSAMLALTEQDYGDEQTRALATKIVLSAPPEHPEEGP
jgi:hypothetical protein